MKRIKKAVKQAIIRFFANRLTDDLITQLMIQKEIICFRKDRSLFDADLFRNGDPVRYASLALAIHRLNATAVDGVFAEVGVWKGATSRIIHHLAPERRLYLFDTFEGFASEENDKRFRDTSLESVKQLFVNAENVVLVPGLIPDTLKQVENEAFAFVLLDLDKYQPTLDSLNFFFPRLQKHGCIFLHDYNNPESDWAVCRATKAFLASHEAVIVEIPDRWGSVVLVKSS